MKDIKRNSGRRGCESCGKSDSGKRTVCKNRNERFIQKISDDHDCFAHKTAEDDTDGTRIFALEGVPEFVEKQSGNQCSQSFDDEGCGSPRDITGENIGKHRADSGREGSGSRTEDDAAEQYQTVAHMNVSKGWCLEFDNHGSNTGKCCHQC